MAVLAATAALGLAACGGGSSSTATGVSTTLDIPPKPDGSTVKDRQPAKSKAAKEVIVPTCPGRVGIFVDSMEGLRRELEVGLSYEQYAAEVDAIRKDYGRVPIEKLSLSCLSAAGTPGERALDRYVAAANTWNACAAEPSCGSARIEKPLQKEWRIAAHFLREAKQGLK